MKSLGSEIARQGGQLPGLAQVRAILVTAIISCQSFELTESFGAFAASVLWPLPLIAWCGLFALLGYCMQAARERHDPKTFALRRLRRFGPVYLIIILLAFLVLGPATSSSSIGNYFRDGESWAYLVNLIAVPRLTLPGVFEFNVLSLTVNAIVLWAPALVLLTVAIGAAPYARRWQRWCLAGAAAALALLAVIGALTGTLSDERNSFVGNLLNGPATAPLFAGLIGAVAWHVRGRVPLDRRIGAAAGGLLILAALFGGAAALESPFATLPIALAASYLALQAVSRRRLGEAIAIKLYPLLYPALCFSFPIQQLFASAAWASASAAINLAFALPAIIAAAAAWWWIERRITRRINPVEATLPPVQPAYAIRRRHSTADRAANIFWIVVVGAILIAMLTALMALTGYALQRPAEGI